MMHDNRNVYTSIITNFYTTKHCLRYIVVYHFCMQCREWEFASCTADISERVRGQKLEDFVATRGSSSCKDFHLPANLEISIARLSSSLLKPCSSQTRLRGILGSTSRQELYIHLFVSCFICQILIKV